MLELAIDGLCLFSAPFFFNCQDFRWGSGPELLCKNYLLPTKVYKQTDHLRRAQTSVFWNLSVILRDTQDIQPRILENLNSLLIHAWEEAASMYPKAQLKCLPAWNSNPELFLSLLKARASAWPHPFLPFVAWWECDTPLTPYYRQQDEPELSQALIRAVTLSARWDSSPVLYPLQRMEARDKP